MFAMVTILVQPVSMLTFGNQYYTQSKTEADRNVITLARNLVMHKNMKIWTITKMIQIHLVMNINILTFMVIHPIVVETLYSKMLIFHQISENFDLLVSLKEKSPKSNISIHPLGTMNICTKFNGNPSNSCQDFSLKAKNVNGLVVLEENHQSGSPSQQDSSSGGRECLYKNPMAISPIVVEIFQSVLNWWTDQSEQPPIIQSILTKQ